MKVCVVGAGVSGLTAIKHLREYGFEVVCFEASQHIAGLWRYNPDDRQGVGSVMRNTILNTSKEFITFSDFPLDENLANFPHNREVYKYLEAYSAHFGLKEYICFESRVVTVSEIEEFADNSLRSTKLRTMKKLEIGRISGTKTSNFNAVIVCNGHHVKPSFPEIPGLRNFKGTVLHSHDYKDHRPFHDRRVLVVGFGNSGGDVACELARVNVSTRHGTWVTRRIVQNGYPRDVILRSRYFEKAMKTLPKKIRQWLALYEYTSFMDHEKYGLRPEELPGESPVLLADDLPLHLASGAIQINNGIDHFGEDYVEFVDGKREIDNVIVCTGYDFDFDFVEDGKVIPTSDNQVRLWKRIFPPGEFHHTLAVRRTIFGAELIQVVGLVDPLGPTMTMAEIQSRTVAHIWAMKMKLPSEREMNEQIDAEKATTVARFKCSARKASLQIDHIAYFDSLASIIGCMPSLDLAQWIFDPKLAFLLNCGPVTASHYRVHGPHHWKEASNYIKGTPGIIAKIKKVTGTFSRVHKGMCGSTNRKVEGTPYGILLFNNPIRILLTFLLAVCLILTTLF